VSDQEEIATLREEMRNASAWIKKLSIDLRDDPTNEATRRLLQLAKDLYNRRAEMLAKMGVDTPNDLT
jgi:hypothetical protein